MEQRNKEMDKKHVSVSEEKSTNSTKSHPKSKFTQDEDAKLKRLVNEYGLNNWLQIAQEMTGRNQRQCRERWLNYLSPMIRKMPWSKDEDMLLERKVREIGPKWVKIAKFFPMRTDIHIKNRWMVLIRKKKKEETSTKRSYTKTKINNEYNVKAMPTASIRTNNSNNSSNHFGNSSNHNDSNNKNNANQKNSNLANNKLISNQNSLSPKKHTTEKGDTNSGNVISIRQPLPSIDNLIPNFSMFPTQTNAFLVMTGIESNSPNLNSATRNIVSENSNSK